MIAVLPVDIQKGLDDWPYWGGDRSTPHWNAMPPAWMASSRTPFPRRKRFRWSIRRA